MLGFLGGRKLRQLGSRNFRSAILEDTRMEEAKQKIARADLRNCFERIEMKCPILEHVPNLANSPGLPSGFGS